MSRMPILKNRYDATAADRRIHCSCRFFVHIDSNHIWQALLVGLCAVEVFKARRAVVGVTLGLRSAWVAHRMQCHGN